MPPLQDPVILAQFQSILANWRVTGYVDWKEIARNWVRRELSPLDPRGIAQMIHKFVQAGGVIDQVPETRPEWSGRSFHYDVRIPIAGRLIYIETILIDDDPSDPVIRVVNIHDA